MAEARTNTIAPVSKGAAMLVPLLNPVKPPGRVDCTELPGAHTRTQEPKLEYVADTSPVVV